MATGLISSAMSMLRLLRIKGWRRESTDPPVVCLLSSSCSPSPYAMLHQRLRNFKKGLADEPRAILLCQRNHP